MTGSRGLFLILAVAVPGMVLLSASTGGRTRWWAVFASGVAVAMAAFAVTLLFPAALDAFLTRAEGSTDLTDRLVAVVGSPVWALGEAGLAGWGIGTTHQASVHLVPPGSAQHTPPAAEGEWERIILEVGPFGFFLMLLVRLLVCWSVWNAWRRSAGDRRPLLAAALLFSLAAVPSHIVFNHTAALFYWFMAGFGLIPPAGPRDHGRTSHVASHVRRQGAFVEAGRVSVS
jgi:hypothetical protein